MRSSNPPITHQTHQQIKEDVNDEGAYLSVEAEGDWLVPQSHEEISSVHLILQVSDDSVNWQHTGVSVSDIIIHLSLRWMTRWHHHTPVTQVNDSLTSSYTCHSGEWLGDIIIHLSLRWMTHWHHHTPVTQVNDSLTSSYTCHSPRSVSPLSTALLRANWLLFIFNSRGTCSPERASESNSSRDKQNTTINLHNIYNTPTIL